jgi:hypothetical protein
VKGVRVPILGTARSLLIRPSDPRYRTVLAARTNGEDVCLVKIERVFHLFVYSQAEVDALADIPRRR